MDLYGGRESMTQREALGRVARMGLLAVLLLGVAWGSAYWVPLPARLSVLSSAVLQYQDGTPAHVLLAGDERWRIAVNVDEVDPAYLEALLVVEDARFWRHPGVDILAIGRALVQDLAAQRVVSGASTLNMQLARVLEPRPRTFTSKAIEAFRALQLEIRMGKRGVLEAYLTFVPYGRNVEGVEAASLAYFGHRARGLAPVEIATLLAVPQNPNHRYPRVENAVALRGARDRLAQRLIESGTLKVEGLTGEALLLQIQGQNPPLLLRPMPREAPHLAQFALSSGDTLPSTLDRGVQRGLEQRLRWERPRLARRGIYNGAVVVLESATGRVRALAGGLDFWEGPGSQIATFAVPRSPGSTLKPLIYGLGMDHGKVLPRSLVPDVPVNYGSYAPGNYDGNFDGLVRLDDALSRSLNLPFVNLLADLGVESFLGALRQGGVESLELDPEHYGLSAAVGGLEITPMELAGLFTALATDGSARVPTWDQRQRPAAPSPILSKGSTWILHEVLGRKDRPDFPDRGRMGGIPKGVRWKTGTSFGHRDAWAVGYNDAYTVAVWLGNLDMRPSSELVGAQAAGPLLFDILESLSPRSRQEDLPMPADLSSVRVCSLTGYVPSKACPSTETLLVPTGNLSTQTCPYHRRIQIDRDTGLRVRPGCRAGRELLERSVLVWPTAVERYMEKRTGVGSMLPPFAPGCTVPVEGGKLSIESPRPGQVALLLPGMDPERQEIPLEASGLGQGQLTWFVNGAFVGRAPATERVWWTPKPGVHQLAVSDGAGRLARSTLEVRMLDAAKRGRGFAPRGPGELAGTSRPE